MAEWAERVRSGVVQRRTGPLLVVLGVLMAIVHSFLVGRVVPGPPLAEAIMAAFPILVALSVAWLGLRIDRSGAITPTTTSAFRRWFALGIAGQLFLSIWIAFTAAFLPPYGYVPPQYAVPTAMTVAVLYGTLLGYYQAQAKHQTQALRERERELRRQNERLEEFTSVVSHDLRNPLNVAQARARQLADREPGKEVDAIERSLDRMAGLVTDLLALARTGETVSETRPVSLADAARRAWEGVQTDQATLAVDGDATFEADPGRLSQVFENLFRNAIEHGNQDVTVRVGPIVDGFYVEDDGPGIPAEDREEVFEFGVTSSPDGTGFGLAIVSGVTRAHDWNVSVRESPTGGARFEFSGIDLDRTSEASSVVAGGATA